MRHVAVSGLGFGDESKGGVVDFLASQGGFDQVVKISGGSQCAHHVVRDDDVSFCFAQFGSATFRGLPTHLSRFFLVDPIRLAAEAEGLMELGVNDPYSLLTVDKNCLVTTPYHCAANRAKEIARGADAHGSCGVGIGETVAFSFLGNETNARLTVGDFLNRDAMHRKLLFIHGFYCRSPRKCVEIEDVPTVEELMDTYSAFAARVQITGEGHRDSMLLNGWSIFEGSQGVLLDEWYGFHPHTTWATTTFANAQELMSESGNPSEIMRIGVVRAYTTRHGAGPLPTESRSVLDSHPEAHNGTGKFQGAWRAGHFDAVLHRYALECVKSGGWDDVKLAVTHLDRPSAKICTAYEYDGMRINGLVPPGGECRTNSVTDLSYQERHGALLEKVRPVYSPMGDTLTSIRRAMGTDIRIESYGPKASDKKTSLNI